MANICMQLKVCNIAVTMISVYVVRKVSLNKNKKLRAIEGVQSWKEKHVI